MEINQTKTILMLNDNTCNPRITIQNEQIEIVNHFKYIGSIIDEQGSKKEILARAAQANQVCSNLKVIGNDKHIILGYNLRLVNYLVTSICIYAYMHACMHACETWKLRAEIETRIT